MNGDGAPDVAIGGESTIYVVFGPLGGNPVDPTALGERGFAVHGRPTDTYYTPDAAGDVNRDGLQDIVIAAANPCDQVNGTFVVFGKRDTTTVDLANLGDAGFRIDGSEAATSEGDYCAGRTMIASGAGDFNADGWGDVAVADRAVNGVYVVFGKSDTAPVAVDSLGTAGVSFDYGFPFDVDGGYDANGDGIADVVVGGRSMFPQYQPDTARVFFGGSDASTEQGFSIVGRRYILNGRYQESVTDGLGDSVAMVDDLNGDGLAEVAVGAPFAPSLGYVPPSPDDMDGPVAETDFGGAVFIVFGRRSTAMVDPYELGDGGYRMGGDGDRSLGRRSSFGEQVSRAGDINGDGLDDIAVVGRTNYPLEGSFSWAVFGKSDAAPQAVTVQSRASDVPGRYLEVVLGLEAAQGPLVGVGDHNEDGRADLLMGRTLVTRPPPPLLPGACTNEVLSAPLRATYATNAGDRISGETGADLVQSLLGDDCVSGAEGPDELDGGDGDDVLMGNAGDDKLVGGLGSDRLVQGTGAGWNLLDGGPGPDRLVGAGGDDVLRGGPGRDRLLGRAWRDRLDGGAGRDVLVGGRGFDWIDAVDGFSDVVRCGARRDRARIDGLDRTFGCERIELLTPP